MQFSLYLLATKLQSNLIELHFCQNGPTWPTWDSLSQAKEKRVQANLFLKQVTKLYSNYITCIFGTKCVCVCKH